MRVSLISELSHCFIDGRSTKISTNNKVLRKTNNSDKTKSANHELQSKQVTYKGNLRKSTRKVSRRLKKHNHHIAQAFILSVIGVLIVASNISPEADSSSYGSAFGGFVASTTIDEVATAQVAKQIAQGAHLLIADNIANLADSLEARVDFAASTDSYLAKPQIIATDARTRQDIIKYVVKKGDTISKLAQRFGVTSDSIRWANDLYGNSLSVGKKLDIPPVSGLIYTVKSGDTAKSLAQKYSANAEHITSFNDAELTGLKKGNVIIIPDGKKPFVTTGTSLSPSFAYGSVTPLYGGNGYSYGYCTWHVANRRAAIGRPLPRNLGNAVTWASIASAGGLRVEENPVAGAVLWHKNSPYLSRGYGHVGFVESVDSQGNAHVSDMNYSAGWNHVSYRTVPKNELNQYLFIY